MWIRGEGLQIEMWMEDPSWLDCGQECSQKITGWSVNGIDWKLDDVQPSLVDQFSVNENWYG